MSPRSLLIPLAAVAFALPNTLSAQAAPTLALGTATSGTTTSTGRPAKYRVSTDAAGVLSVAVSGTADFVIAVTDVDGQQLRDGTADRDMNGQVGLEYLAVVLPRPGQYGVEIRTNGEDESAAFRIVTAFAPMAAFEVPEDTDGRPGNARVVEVGAVIEDQINADGGDRADWYTVTSKEAMTLIVVTRVEDGTNGDLILEAFVGDDLEDSAARSDQDLRGHAGNESLTVEVSRMANFNGPLILFTNYDSGNPCQR